MKGSRPRAGRKRQPADAPDWSASFDDWTPDPLPWTIDPDPWTPIGDDWTLDPLPWTVDPDPVENRTHRTPYKKGLQNCFSDDKKGLRI